MKGKITDSGCLCIERAGEMVWQRCRIGERMTGTKEYHTCDHNCPHFREPQYLQQLNGEPTGTVILDICEGTRLVFCQSPAASRGGGL